ncbi:NADH:flavin oxidoreductase [Dyadobacter sp. LJ53]|uniref:oxidoreductase n=1 Tax=Dyadobacter chenwenxiniae TaxID=2906456 RepID=UPI001F41968A|nr:NADH:flavin oxidoreductase [Dyadobacter chenwenxiniae]MCF0051874.1 NADH:flavin oxidoreductase [Dyadobacter chenwenxiniae]
MEMRKSSLFDPQKLHGGRKLRNRLVVAPLTRKSATSEGVPTQEMADYYGAFAEGGFGMIITEGTYTDPLFSQSDLNQPGITHEGQMLGWKKVTEKVHRHDTVFINQLMHAGALGQLQEHTIAPSAVRPIGKRSTEFSGLTGPFPLPRVMERADFEAVERGYVHAATLSREAGFDGIEIHAANGYLFDQFLTEHTNLRMDQYGGDVRNRLRFLMEVYQAIRDALPADFIIGIRLSESKVNDLTYRWPGGSQTATEIFEVLSGIQPDYFHIASEGGSWKRESLYADGLSSTGIAKKLTRIPIIANGGLHDIELAESLLASDQADLISIGRAAIANPDWPNRILKGQETIPFFKDLIKPSLTLKHTEQVLSQYLQQTAPKRQA